MPETASTRNGHLQREEHHYRRAKPKGSTAYFTSKQLPPFGFAEAVLPFKFAEQTIGDLVVLGD